MPSRPRECLARVTARRALAPEILEVDLGMADPPVFHFDAGQWVSVPFGPKTVRAYSIASTPQWRSTITLCADVAPGGIGSRWFRELRAGDEVRFKGPTGGFVYDRADRCQPLFVAEEIGIVPIRSILAHLFETGFGRPAALVYWARDTGWLAYDADFRACERRYPGFAYHPVVGEAADGWQGAHGDVVDVVRRVGLAGPLVAYVAGGGQTINRVREALMARGLDRKAVKWEKFW
ncbi:MAG: ferredoxin--NADP reductase [Candidatus Rokuibacteriota bacterium]